MSANLNGAWRCSACFQLNAAGVTSCANPSCKAAVPKECSAVKVDNALAMDCVHSLLPKLCHVLRQLVVDADIISCTRILDARDERLSATTRLCILNSGVSATRMAEIKFRRTEAGQALLLGIDFIDSEGKAVQSHPITEAGLDTALDASSQSAPEPIVDMSPENSSNQPPPLDAVAEQIVKTEDTEDLAGEPSIVELSNEGSGSDGDHDSKDALDGCTKACESSASGLEDAKEEEHFSPVEEPEPPKKRHKSNSESSSESSTRSSPPAIKTERAAQGCAYWLSQMASGEVVEECSAVESTVCDKSDDHISHQEVQYRVLSRLEKLFWTYYDDVKKGEADVPRPQLIDEFRRFTCKVLAAIPGLVPLNHSSPYSVLRAFEKAKCTAPRAYLVMLNKMVSQVVMVKQVRNQWWFLPGGKQEPQESSRIAALREAFEETGFDATPYLTDVEVEMKGTTRPIRIWFATNVPEDFHFAPQTVGEVADVGWRLLDSHASNQSTADHWVSRLLSMVCALQDHAKCQQGPHKRLKFETPDLICHFDGAKAEHNAFVGALCTYRDLCQHPVQTVPRASSPVHCLAVSGAPPSANWRSLRDIMAPFGTIHTVYLPPPSGTEPPNPALVAFHDQASRDAAISALDGCYIMEGATEPLTVTLWDDGNSVAPIVPLQDRDVDIKVEEESVDTGVCEGTASSKAETAVPSLRVLRELQSMELAASEPDSADECELDPNENVESFLAKAMVGDDAQSETSEGNASRSDTLSLEKNNEDAENDNSEEDKNEENEQNQENDDAGSHHSDDASGSEDLFLPPRSATSSSTGLTNRQLLSEPRQQLKRRKWSGPLRSRVYREYLLYRRKQLQKRSLKRRQGTRL